MKQCFKCDKIKPLSEFYKHHQMPDGHVNKCKECNKSDVRANRKEKVEYYREYDRERGSRQTPEYHKLWKEKNSQKYRAQTMVGNAVRDKRLFKEPCEVCGKKKGVHAHHDDYLKPLNVRWLCPVHHKEWHTNNGEGKNGR